MKALPTKINVFLWRLWNRRIPTDDNLRKIKFHLVCRCKYCEVKKVETMTHVFLIAPIAKRLWRQFANFIGIKLDDMHLQQLITTW